MRHSVVLLAAAVAIIPLSAAVAEERVVSTTEQLIAALDAAEPGDEVVLRPGVYQGGIAREGLREITIRSADPGDPAVIEGGSYGMHLMDPVDVTLANLVFRNQTDMGLNIDDAGSPETPASGIRLVGITVRDVAGKGNNDGIKLAGVRDFLIDRVKVENWGNDGSGIDFVGCHHGLVQNSSLRHESLTVGGSGIRPKGGSKDIVIRANRIKLTIGAGRAVQAGGFTDPEFFRFVDGDQGYEASDIVVEGNVIIGSGSAFSWVNIDGGFFHHNFVYRPGQWVARILNESPGDEMVDTQNGQLHDNWIVFNDVDDEFNTAVNVGDETVPESFSFARNRWFNQADPTPEGSTPKLPAEEDDGVYGEEPPASFDAPQVWDFAWGKWIVNANTAPKSVDLSGYETLRRAVPGRSGKFKPLLDDPLTGKWTTKSLRSATVELPAMSQVILIDTEACPDCAAGD